ncbi:MAG: PKD domain-containing protein [Deltaproteobacteria bacterium]|nr:PKD domain-containing protein [Deltaproteobacteria bacterium]
MRTTRLCTLTALLALSSTACMLRLLPNAGEAQTNRSGVPMSFGAPAAQGQETPEGTVVRWDFGDGTSAEGRQVTHAFPRAGTFTVTEIIKDKDGQERKASTQVTILRRAVPSAIPADARAAVVLERPWARAALHKRLAERVGLGELYEEYVRGVRDGLGFDFTDTAQLEANGFDSDEGLALYTIPQDKEALIAVAGISDLPKAEAALRKLLSRPGDAGPFELTESKLADGTRAVVGTRLHGAERVAYIERYGYLYLRTPGASDPLLALQSAAQLGPDAGLAKEAAWLDTQKRVGQGDLTFWSSSASDTGLRAARFAGELDTAAFAVDASPDCIRVNLFSQLKSLSGSQLVTALTPAGPPTDLASKFPAGAALFLKLSGSPPIVWKEFLRTLGSDEPAVTDKLKAWLGADVQADLLPGVSGNGVVAVYLDAQSLIGALLGEQVAAWDRSTFLFAGQLVPEREPAIRKALDHASQSDQPDSGPHAVGAATFWKLSEGLQVAIQDHVMFAALGGIADAPAEGQGPGDKAIALIGRKSTVGTDAGADSLASSFAQATMSERAQWALMDKLTRALVAAADKADKNAKKPAAAKPDAKASKADAKAAKPDTKAAKSDPKSAKAAAKSGKKPEPKAPAWVASDTSVGPLASILMPAADVPRLNVSLQKAAVPSLLEPTHQVAWVDLAGMLKSLEAAGQNQGGLVSAGIELLTKRARDLQGLQLDAAPGPDGLTVKARLRLTHTAGNADESCQ